MATIQSVAVIVAQAGADVACLVEAAGRNSSNAAVELFQQAAGETETQLSQRLRSRLSSLNANGVHVSTASFVAKSGFGSDDVLSAAGLVRGLVALMVAVGAGTVHLHATPRDRRAAVALAALTDALSEQLRGTGVALDADVAWRATSVSSAENLPVQPVPPQRERVAVA